MDVSSLLGFSVLTALVGGGVWLIVYCAQAQLEKLAIAVVGVVGPCVLVLTVWAAKLLGVDVDDAAKFLGKSG